MVAKVVKKMKIPVTFINITQISEYRIDGHSSVYTETGGKLLTEEERANPQNADCIHWCLPGVPDTLIQHYDIGFSTWVGSITTCYYFAYVDSYLSIRMF